MLYLILVVLLVLALVSAPTYGVWNHGYGWGPSGGLGVILIIIVVVLLLRGGL